MSVNEKIDRLSQELGKQSLGPIDTISDEVMRRLGSASGSMVAWLRQAAYRSAVDYAAFGVSVWLSGGSAWASICTPLIWRRLLLRPDFRGFLDATRPSQSANARRINCERMRSWPRSYLDFGALFLPIVGDEVPTLNNDIVRSPTAYYASCPSNHLIRSSSISVHTF